MKRGLFVQQVAVASTGVFAFAPAVRAQSVAYEQRGLQGFLPSANRTAHHARGDAQRSCPKVPVWAAAPKPRRVVGENDTNHRVNGQTTPGDRIIPLMRTAVMI